MDIARTTWYKGPIYPFRLAPRIPVTSITSGLVENDHPMSSREVQTSIGGSAQASLLQATPLLRAVLRW